MESATDSIITPPEGLEPQKMTTVGGSGGKPGANITGPLRLLLYDREGVGVISRAPVSL